MYLKEKLGWNPIRCSFIIHLWSEMLLFVYCMLKCFNEFILSGQTEHSVSYVVIFRKLHVYVK